MSGNWDTRTGPPPPFGVNNNQNHPPNHVSGPFAAPVPNIFGGAPAPYAFGQAAAPTFGALASAPVAYAGVAPSAYTGTALYSASRQTPPVPTIGWFGAAQHLAPATSFGAPTAPAANLFVATPAAPFGQQQQPAPAGVIFGGGTPAPGPFGLPAPAQQPCFGGAQSSSTPAPAPTFGQGSLFGGGSNTPAPAPFGTPAPATTGFGAPAPTFGQQNLFGGCNAPAPASLFGGAAPAPFGGSFGGAATLQPAPMGMFGSSAPPAPFGAPAGCMFGGIAPAPFGAAPQQQQQQQQYGGYAGQPQTLFAPNVPTLTSPAKEVQEQNLRAMENQRECPATSSEPVPAPVNRGLSVPAPSAHSSTAPASSRLAALPASDAKPKSSKKKIRVRHNQKQSNVDRNMLVGAALGSQYECQEIIRNKIEQQRDYGCYRWNEESLMNGNCHDLLVFYRFILCHPLLLAASFTDSSIDEAQGNFKLAMSAVAAPLFAKTMGVAWRLGSFYSKNCKKPHLSVSFLFRMEQHRPKPGTNVDLPPHKIAYDKSGRDFNKTLTNDYNSQYFPVVFDDEVGFHEIAHFGILWRAFANILRERFREVYNFQHLCDMQRDYTMDQQIIIFNRPDAYVRTEIKNALVRLEQLLQVGPNGITNKWFRHSIYWLFSVFPGNNDEPVVTAQEKQTIRTALLQGTVSTQTQCQTTAPWVIYLKELRGNFSKSRVTFDVSKWQILLGCFSIDAYRNRWLRALLGFMILFDGGAYKYQTQKRIMLLVGLTPSDEDKDEEDDESDQEDVDMAVVDDIADATNWAVFIRHLFHQCFNLDSVPMVTERPAPTYIDTENPIARITINAADPLSRVARAILPHVQETIGYKETALLALVNVPGYQVGAAPQFQHYETDQELLHPPRGDINLNAAAPLRLRVDLPLDVNQLVSLWRPYLEEQAFFFRWKERDEPPVDEVDIIFGHNRRGKSIGHAHLRDLIEGYYDANEGVGNRRPVQREFLLAVYRAGGRFRQEVVSGADVNGNPVLEYQQLTVAEAMEKIRRMINN